MHLVAAYIVTLATLVPCTHGSLAHTCYLGCADGSARAQVCSPPHALAAFGGESKLAIMSSIWLSFIMSRSPGGRGGATTAACSRISSSRPLSIPSAAA